MLAPKMIRTQIVQTKVIFESQRGKNAINDKNLDQLSNYESDLFQEQ